MAFCVICQMLTTACSSFKDICKGSIQNILMQIGNIYYELTIGINNMWNNDAPKKIGLRLRAMLHMNAKMHLCKTEPELSLT